MNRDQITGILRAFIPGVVALLAAYNIGNEGQNTIIVTAVVSICVAAWSAYTNKPGTVIAPASPEVVITKETPAATIVVTSSGTAIVPK